MRAEAVIRIAVQEEQMNKPKFVYVTYIASTPEQVWRALTDPTVTQKYWYGFRVAANGKAGEHMTAIDPDGKEVHRDVILVSDPPCRLAYAWRPLYDSARWTCRSFGWPHHERRQESP
jgi:uncharacterized protein YndB with AHSA1/START domain